MVDKPAAEMDPRIRRTRQLLQDALGKLLRQKSFDDVSVQDIADAATLNRATFYDHYADKFCLLECVVAQRFNELLAERQVDYDKSCTSGLRAIVLAVCDYLAALLGPDRGRRIEPQMETAIIGVLRTILLGGLKEHGSADDARIRMTASAAAWAIYGAAKEWAHAPQRPSSEKIADPIAGLVAPILHTLYAASETHVAATKGRGSSGARRARVKP